MLSRQEQPRDLKDTQQFHGKATADLFERVIEMPRNIYVVLYVLVLITVVVSVDSGQSFSAARPLFCNCQGRN
jgi:hypothetical protein